MRQEPHRLKRPMKLREMTPSYRRLPGRSAANSHLPVLNPATQAVAKRRAVAIPHSQNCPISAAFAASISTAPTARLKSDRIANT